MVALSGVVWPARMVGRVLYWGARYGGGRWVAAFWGNLRCRIVGELDDQKNVRCGPTTKDNARFVQVESRKLIQDCGFVPEDSASELLL